MTTPTRGNNFDLCYISEPTTRQLIYHSNKIWVSYDDGPFEELNPPLEGFERVLGRKFTCGDCDNKYGIGCWFPQINHCESYFKLSDKTKAEIKLKDKEIEDTKIDTHPRYPIQQSMIHYLMDLKLELIL